MHAPELKQILIRVQATDAGKANGQTEKLLVKQHAGAA